jgi:hypothetical protein
MSAPTEPAFDRRVPPREDCVAPQLLERWARDTPPAVFGRLTDGPRGPLSLPA